ncbi:unnamed protein product [Lampetra planeri]
MGRHYWEVGIGAEDFRVGIAYGTLERKGLDDVSGLGRNEHSWCLQKLGTGYTGLHKSKSIPVKVMQSVSKVGIYLDYEKGTLMFYNPDSMTLLYTAFANTVYPALWVGNGSIKIL